MNPGDTSILLPVQDGNIADCRAAGVKFVRVQLDLDFADLTIAANPAPNVVLWGEYYIQLPQNSRNLTNNAGAAYTLTSWIGTADLRTMTTAEVQRDILGYTQYMASSSLWLYASPPIPSIKLCLTNWYQAIPSSRTTYLSTSGNATRRRQYGQVGRSGVLQHLSQRDQILL
jgi:hypothetical protein